MDTPAHEQTNTCECEHTNTNINTDTNTNNQIIQDKINKLSAYIKNYCIFTIKGFESGLFKLKYATDSRIPYELTNQLVSNNIFKCVTDYHNSTYSALILDSDINYTKFYYEMNQIIGHSYICLLNITLMVSDYMLKTIDRTKLDTSSYEKYMGSIQVQYIDVLNQLDLENTLSHNCTGIDIRTCDPTKKLFKLMTRTVLN